MSYLGCFDLFKIGIGSSSSHTVGPMRAARRFLRDLPEATFDQISKVEVELFGSLAHTGKGHATDTAMVLGFHGLAPEDVDTGKVSAFIGAVTKTGRLKLLGTHEVGFSPLVHIRFNLRDLLPVHSNGMQFRAHGSAGILAERAMYSIGGGFVVDDDEVFVGTPRGDEHSVPYPFASMKSLLATCASQGVSMAALLRANENALRPAAETDAFLDRVAQTMFACMDRGMATEGTLPGGLNVPRRAHGIHQQLLAEHGGRPLMPHQVMDWVSVYAIAVSEENAASGRAVTAPTNGAAGVVPAVLRYARDFLRRRLDENARLLSGGICHWRTVQNECVHFRR